MISSSNVTTLIIALRTEDRRAHTLVVDDLVKIGPPAVEPLLEALRDPSPLVRAGAARALGKIGDNRALGELIFRLRYDDDAEVRKSAVWALHMGEAKAVDPLIEALCDENEWVRFGAVIVLAKIGTQAVKSLIGALHHNNALVRANAAETLGRIGDRRSIEALADALDDEDERVWQQVTVSLGRMGDARAVVQLVKIVRSDVSDLRTKAIKALGYIRDVRAVDTLIDVVYEEQDRWVRMFAIEALGHIGDLRAVEALMDAAYDESQDLRTKAIVTLGEIEYTLALDGLNLLANDYLIDVEDRQTALFELGKRGDPRALEPLIELLRGAPHPETRMYAALVLGEMGLTEAVEQLAQTLCDDDPDVAAQANKSLIKMGAVAVEPLVDMLAGASDAEYRLWVVRVLGEIGGKKAFAALTRIAVSDSEPLWMRDEALEALKRWNHNEQAAE